jgi:UDP-2-acetamido-3-amino-2,3-dideoxy-glucuronate N-acetyltransferase
MSISILARVSSEAIISKSAKIWDYVQVRENARISDGSIIGKGAYIGPGVEIDKNCKIQNYALIYEPAKLDQGVFIGPGVIFTNDKFPRSITPDFSLKGATDWDPVGVYVKEGASIGAGSICIAPVEIGRWAMIAAGSVVTKNVSDFALMAGNPARRIGWVGKFGRKLVQDQTNSSKFICSETGAVFYQKNTELLIPEDQINQK